MTITQIVFTRKQSTMGPTFEGRRDLVSKESWIGVFDDALLTELFHYSVTFQADGAILDVELLKSAKVWR